MTKKKLNCWEHKKCERQPGGKLVYKFGLCRATRESRLDGVHGGDNGGRSCWVVAGTFCGGKVQGTFARKYETCKECDFYKMVLGEEGSNLEITLSLFKRLREDEE